MKVKIRKITLLILGILIIASVVFSCNIWLFFSLVILVLLFNHYSFDLGENCFFLFFLVAFFTFLMSGQMMHDFFGYSMRYVTEPDEFSFLNICILISLIFIAFGYYIGGYASRHRSIKLKSGFFDNHILSLRFVSKWMFYVFAVAWYLILIEQCFVVQTSRYVDLYTYSSRLPGIIDQISEACPIAFCVFLATLPSKKEARLPLILVFLYACISLLIGRRLFFVTYSFLILAYRIVRTNQSKSEEVWINRKQIITLVCILPVLIIFLYSYKYIRYGRNISAATPYEAFLGFFAQQGFSASLIVAGKKYIASIPDKIYSFWGLIRFLRVNVISKYILGLESVNYYRGTTTELALNSGSFARIMGYILIPVGYSKGYGVGSCYVAELYHDFGYLGIALGNFVYGLCIGRIIKLKENSCFGNAVALLMFYQILAAPRYNFDRPFVMFVSLNFWTVMLLIYVGIMLAEYRSKSSSLK